MRLCGRLFPSSLLSRLAEMGIVPLVQDLFFQMVPRWWRGNRCLTSHRPWTHRKGRAGGYSHVNSVPYRLGASAGEWPQAENICQRTEQTNVWPPIHDTDHTLRHWRQRLHLELLQIAWVTFKNLLNKDVWYCSWRFVGKDRKPLVSLPNEEVSGVH